MRKLSWYNDIWGDDRLTHTTEHYDIIIWNDGIDRMGLELVCRKSADTIDYIEFYINNPNFDKVLISCIEEIFDSAYTFQQHIGKCDTQVIIDIDNVLNDLMEEGCDD